MIDSRYITQGLLSADGVQLIIGFGLIVLFLLTWAYWEWRA